MKAQAGGADRLVRLAEWGQVSIVEGAAAGSAMVVDHLNVSGIGRTAGSVAKLAQRWCDSPHPALAEVLDVSVGDIGAGQVVRIERRAPRGSTLAELIAAHGPVDPLAAAALFVDVLEAVDKHHRQGMFVGMLGPNDLFVRPPGASSGSALQIFNAGLPNIIWRASGAIGSASERRFEHVYPVLNVMAPEVAAGESITDMSDTYMICATIAFALLGQHVHQGSTRWAVRERVEAGLTHESVAALRAVEPELGDLLARGMSVERLLRRGVLRELKDRFIEALGPSRYRRITASNGGDPWAMGSPLISLAAYVRARPYADRFEGVEPAVGPAPTDQGTDDEKDERIAKRAEQARIAEALARLEMHQARENRRPRAVINVLKVLVVVATIGIVIAIAYVGWRKTEAIANGTDADGRPLSVKKVRKAPTPKVLYTTPSSE